MKGVQELKVHCSCGAVMSLTTSLILTDPVQVIVSGQCTNCPNKRYSQVALNDLIDRYLFGSQRLSWRYILKKGETSEKSESRNS